MGYVDSLLGRNERIVFLTRQHWIHLLPIGLARLLVIGALVAAGALLLGSAGGVSLAVAIVLALVPLGDFVR
ncbi:MAG: hypothetical protein KAS81_01865, partial [Anaerolineales bacterium]|nr:hypothetical protein [Anaerolineales bacterium]